MKRRNFLLLKLGDLGCVVAVVFLTVGIGHAQTVVTLTPTAAEVPVGSPVTWTAAISDGSDEEARVVLRATTGAIRVRLAAPGVVFSPLSVAVTGTDIFITLASDPAGQLSSTAAQVAGAINADVSSGALVVASTWPGHAGTGIVQPQALTQLSTVYIAVGSPATLLPCYTNVPGWCRQTYTQSEPGTQSVEAFLDVNRNALHDIDEPSAMGTATWVDPTPVDSTSPTISITDPAEGATYAKGQSLNASFVCADESGGSGLASCVGSVTNGAPINTSTVGSHSFAVTATDNAGNSATVTKTYNVVYVFSGFLQPIESIPTTNVVSAGGAIAVKFSLSGNQGLAILAAGYPESSPILCDAEEPGVVIQQTMAVGNSSLSYNASTDQYAYVWKTDRSWKATCRMLAVRFNDNTVHLAKFRFR